jgi:hypothetical protein
MVGSTSGTLTIATTLHHYMHTEDPDLIVDGIRPVLAARPALNGRAAFSGSPVL